MSLTTKHTSSAPDLEQMIAEADTGNRQPQSRIAIALLVMVPLLWSLFQLWIG